MVTMLLALAAATSQSLPLPRLFGDWVVSCDNSLDCAASSLAPERDTATATWIVSIRRSGERGSKPLITLEPFGDLPGAITLVADGKVRLQFASDGKLAPVPVMQAANTIANAQRLAATDAAGKTLAFVSPKGASAALRYIDAVQHRDGTLDALVAVGRRPPSTVPPPPLPRIAVPPPSGLPPVKLSRRDMEKARAGHDCAPFSELPDSFTPDFDRLDAATTLGIVPCMLAAYQGNAVVVLIDNGGRFRPAPIDDPFAGPGVPPTSSLLVDPQWESRVRALWSNALGRGLGDCGQTVAYVWNGTAFRIAYADVMEPCRGSLERLPVWRSANVPGPRL